MPSLFTKSLSVEQFSQLLLQQKSVWMRKTAGAPSHLRKRFVRGKTRQWIERYKKSSGIQHIQLPKRISAAQISYVDANPDAVKIVIVPNEAAQASEATAQRRRRTVSRKSAKRILRTLAQHDFELQSSNSSAKPRLRKSTVTSQSAEIRFQGTAVFLEALGAIICPELSDLDIGRLKNEGAVVLSNEPIELADPIEADQSADQLHFWHLSHINAAAAHDKGIRGKGVLIGILDTGIDVSHREFFGKTVSFRAFGPSGDELQVAPKDFHKHGTHVSALCAGRYAGVAPDADLAVAAVLTTRNKQGQMSGRPAQILRGINWLVQGGAPLPRPVDIINASFGGRGLDPYYYSQLNDAHDIDGIATIAAIGNNGRMGINNHGSPGNYDMVLGVGAVDSSDHIAPFSDWGTVVHHTNGSTVDKPDIVAPGVDVVSAVPGGTYEAMSGTSMASPVVAGALALILQKRREANDQGTDGLIKEMLTYTRPQSGRPHHPQSARRGHGSLDLGTI